MCKDLLQAQLSCNHLVINILQNLLFCIPKVAVLHDKIISKIQLIGNKKVSLFVKLNR